MTNEEARFQCRHILADGRRCRAACLRHEEFCYYHHASRKPVTQPAERKSRRAAFTMPRIEDRASIQAALNDVIARIAANDIDPRRAGRLLYAIQIASSNMPRHSAPKPVDEDVESGLVEEVVLHPAFGEIAPRSELSRPQERKSLAQQLREEMEALEARNIAEFGASADDEQDDTEASANCSTMKDLQDKLQQAREELDSNQDRIKAMHTDLARYREELAKAKAQVVEARADLQCAENGMVYHMDRQHEAIAELEAFKAATQSPPAILEPCWPSPPIPEAVVLSSHGPVILSVGRSAARDEPSRRTPKPMTSPLLLGPFGQLMCHPFLYRSEGNLHCTQVPDIWCMGSRPLWAIHWRTVIVGSSPASSPGSWIALTSPMPLMAFRWSNLRSSPASLAMAATPSRRTGLRARSAALPPEPSAACSRFFNRAWSSVSVWRQGNLRLSWPCLLCSECHPRIA